MTSYCADKPNFLKFLIKIAKMTLKVKVNDLHFQYQPRLSQDACLEQILVSLAQICDELLCGQGKVYGRTDRRRQRQYPEGLKMNIGVCGIMNKQGKSDGFDSCDRHSNLTQTGFKCFIFQPV